MKKGTAINLNRTVKVFLTKEGINIIYDYYKTTKIETKIQMPNYSITMLLWELINIFAESLYMGCNIPFVDNQIILIEEE